MDFVRDWADKTAIAAGRFLIWIGIGTSKFHDWELLFGKVKEHNTSVPRDHWLTDTEKERIRGFAHQHRQQQRQATGNPAPAAPASRPAIDFAALRAVVTMAAVLQLLGFQSRSSHGVQQRGPCPLHGSTSGTSRCFSANLEQHIFHCFKCGRSGNALDLWAHATGQSTYDAAIDLCQRLHLSVPELSAPKPRPILRNRAEEPVAPPVNDLYNQVSPPRTIPLPANSNSRVFQFTLSQDTTG